MTQIENIEKILKFTYTDDNGELKIYEDAVKNIFSDDKNFNSNLEKANSVCEVFNTSENKDLVSEMEIEDIIKLIK